MRITVGLQIRSEKLSADTLASVVGYDGRLVVKGLERVPSRSTPRANAWTGDVIVFDEADSDLAVKRCLAQFPSIEERINILRTMSTDIECTLYVGLRPFSQEFALFFEKDTIEHLANMACEMSIEYFDEMVN